MTVHERIKKHREENRYSQDEYAKLFNLKQKSISRYEINTSPSFKYLYDIAKKFPKDLVFIITGEHEDYTKLANTKILGKYEEIKYFYEVLQKKYEILLKKSVKNGII